MSAYVLELPDGQFRDVVVGVTLRIGTADDNELPLPLPGVDAHHAVISRSSRFQVPVLVDLTGEPGRSYVNGRRVVMLRVLRHRDSIELGQARLVFWEMTLRRVRQDSSWSGKKCPVCLRALTPGDEVVSCPRCRMPHHKRCWFLLTICSSYGCEYPVADTLSRILAPRMRFERLEDGHALLKEQRRCPAKRRRDGMPFKSEEHVGYCPQCDGAFHPPCWFALDQCPRCSYPAAKLIDDAFAREPA